MNTNQTKGTGLVINFSPAVVIIQTGGIQIRTTQVVVVKTIDDPVNKTVTAVLKGGKTYILWSGQDYDSIGQWTDTEVTQQITNFIKAGK